ncbi:MAG: neutral/alkaline non-lysosomal ceramidase N-terminal domain-containing protein [Myxococcota bacterium]
MLRRLSAILLGIALSSMAACSSGTPTPPAPECGYHSDCPSGGVCYKNKCYGTATCVERHNCEAVPVCADSRCFCDAKINRCLPVCETDNDCPSDGHCMDGQCKKYPVAFDKPVPGGGAKTALKVGIGRVPLDFPMGVSMAGYGTRFGPETPYRASLGGSDTWFDRPDVRALAFDDGETVFVLLRVPLGWSEAFLVSETARKVQDKTGLNLSERIITSAPHSHALPARFWHLVVGLNFGIFGYDEFSWEIFDRLTDSFAAATIAALDDRKPAKFGWTEIANFDPDNKIHHDRRPENNNLPGDVGADPRMVLMRIDDMDGHPRAIMTNFGMHGTVFDSRNPILTGDAPGGVEVELTRRASEKYGTDVMGVFLQGNAGDISPGGDQYNHPPLEQIQVVGRMTWAAIEPVLDTIQTSADIPLDIMTGWVVMSHDALGYTGHEFHDVNVVCDDTPDYFRYGAFQCVDGHFHDSDPATKYEDGVLDCVFSVECLTSGFPVPNFQKTHLAVLRIGDLAIDTLPGEPVSKLGMTTAARTKAALPWARGAFTLGYSMDHHFYLLTEDDWRQGGYEPSRDIWGWRMAPYFADNSEKLAKELAKPKADRVWDNQNLKPLYWDRREEDSSHHPINDTEGDPAAVVADVPETVRRLDVVYFSWSGGHPGVDQPTITLEQKVQDTWTPVLRPGGRPYTDGMFEMLVHYEGLCGRDDCTKHRWSVEWEESRSFPAGVYRLKAAGKAQTHGQVADYVSTSRAFTLVPTDQLEVYQLSASATGLEGRVLDPVRVAFETKPDHSVVSKEHGFLLRSPVMPARFGTPLDTSLTVTATGTVRAPGGVVTTFSGPVTLEAVAAEPRTVLDGYTADAQPVLLNAGMKPTTKLRVAVPAIAQGAPGDYRVTLTLKDSALNSGTITATVTKP